MVLLLVSKRSYGMMVIHIQMAFVILLPVVNVSFSPLEDRLYKLTLSISGLHKMKPQEHVLKGYSLLTGIRKVTLLVMTLTCLKGALYLLAQQILFN